MQLSTEVLATVRQVLLRQKAIVQQVQRPTAFHLEAQEPGQWLSIICTETQSGRALT